VIDYFIDLYKENRQITLLSWCYSALTIVFVMIAGLIALLNQPLGVGVLIVPLVCVVALCMNIVFWALIHLAIDTKSKNDEKKKSAKKATKTKKTAKTKKSTKSTKKH
jgi:phosphotransferase system  glucose/maltose/N-acetylglucosamine-specific IIC component